MMKKQLGYNIDRHNCCRCIKAGYYKMGVGNLLYHPDDGFTAPCVMEFDYETVNVTDDNDDRRKQDSSLFD